MKTSSSQAGTRLARAKAALDEIEVIGKLGLPHLTLHYAELEFEDAARAVADELVAAGFADAEGDDA